MPTTDRRYPSTAVIRSLIALAAVLLAVWIELSPALSDGYFANEWLRDHFVRMRAATTPEQRIAVVDIDEASLTAVGPWPWPRSRLAELIERLLGEYGAQGIALDMVLPESADREGDLRLAKLGQFGPVVFAQAFDYGARSLPLRVGSIGGGLPLDLPGAPAASGYIGNHDGLRLTRQVGNIGFVPDQDGKLRRLPLLTAFAGKHYPSLALALLASRQAAGQLEGSAVRRVPFARQMSAYTVVPAAEILAGQAPQTAIAGRWVLVGASALGLGDRVSTPLSPSTSGVMVHAALLTDLLDQQGGQAPAAWPGLWLAIACSVLVALTAITTLPRLSAASNMLILGGASLLWLVAAYWICPHDANFSVTGPLACNLFLLAVAVPFDWQMTQRKTRQVLETLRHYVAPVVVDELLRSGLKDPLAPQRLSVTTLIADMEGYTKHVASLPIEAAGQLTRDFLECLTRPVLDHRGTLDKYTGDGLVAFWGAPLPIPDHADQALDAALKIVQEVARFNLVRQRQGQPALRVRIGIESGIAMAGDFGTSFRSIFTAVGDSVNVAARLEGVARDQAHDIIVGAGTAAMARRHRCRLLGEVVLRGKDAPTKIFTPEG